MENNGTTTVRMTDLKPEDIFRPNGFAEIDSTRSWVDPNGYRLSDRLWRSRATDRRQIDQVLREGLAKGASPLETARALERHLNPYYQPRRDPNTFRVLPKSRQPKGVATVTPRQGPGKGVMRPRNSGTGSYAARRLARTETTRAFGDAAMKAAKANPVLEKMRWRLSGHHDSADSDQCDLNAQNSSKGLPKGVYWVDELPRYPDHPHEMCTLTPYVTQADLDHAVQRLRHYVNTGEMPDRTWRPPPGGVQLMRPVVPAPAPTPPPGPPPAATPPTDDAWIAEVLELKRQAEEEGRGATRRNVILEKVKRAGEIMKPRVYANLDPADIAAMDKVGKARLALIAAERKEAELAAKLRRKRKADPVLEAELTDARVQKSYASGQLLGANMEAGEHFQGRENPFRDAVKKAYEPVRPIGGGKPQHFTPNSSPKARQAVIDGAENLPREWMDQSADFGEINAASVARGYYQHSGRGGSKVAISGGRPENMENTAIHEMTHRVEALRRTTVLPAENAFFEERAGTEKPTWLGAPYRKTEKAVRDEFQSPYMGKDYGGYYYELATMGIEDLMTKESNMPGYLLGDDDYQTFIFGLLAIG